MQASFTLDDTVLVHSSNGQKPSQNGVKPETYVHYPLPTNGLVDSPLRIEGLEKTGSIDTIASTFLLQHHKSITIPTDAGIAELEVLVFRGNPHRVAFIADMRLCGLPEKEFVRQYIVRQFARDTPLRRAVQRGELMPREVVFRKHYGNPYGIGPIVEEPGYSGY